MAFAKLFRPLLVDWKYFFHQLPLGIRCDWAEIFFWVHDFWTTAHEFKKEKALTKLHNGIITSKLQ